MYSRISFRCCCGVYAKLGQTVRLGSIGFRDQTGQTRRVRQNKDASWADVDWHQSQTEDKRRKDAKMINRVFIERVCHHYYSRNVFSYLYPLHIHSHRQRKVTFKMYKNRFEQHHLLDDCQKKVWGWLGEKSAN